MASQVRTTWLGRLLASRTALLVQLLILAFLLFSFGREFARNYTIHQEITDLEAEKISLEAQNSDISALMNSVQTETYIEREARIKLGLAKPGEKVVVLPGSQISKNTSVTEDGANVFLTSEDPVDLSSIANIRKWWYYFFDTNKFEMIKYYGNTSVR